MGQILRHWRVITATLFSVVLIFGTYILARGIQNPSRVEASEETALLKAIASKDTDADGLPDWEEALYGTDPSVVDSFHLSMTDGEAVAKGLIVPKAIADLPVNASVSTTISSLGLPPPPEEGTLIDAFSKRFFSLYINAKQANGGTDLSAADTSVLVNQALESLLSSVSTTPAFKSAGDVVISEPGQDALRVYAVDAEAVFRKNVATATTSELIYLQMAVEDNDAFARTQLASISKAYRDSATGLAVLPVPPELASAGLALVNAMMRVSQITGDFARVNVDSLTAMLSLQQYVPAANALVEAFADVSAVYRAAGLRIGKDSPGAAFIDLADRMAVKQQEILKKP